MNNVARFGCTFLIGLLLSQYACAQYQAAGETNYQHLLLDYDARSVGMAGASVAVPGGVSGVLSNPALLADVDRLQGFIGYQMVLDGVWGAPLLLAKPIKNWGTVALVMQGLSSGDVRVIGIDRYSEGPVYTNLVAHNETFTMGLAFARTINGNLSLGGVVKGLYHYISAPPDVYSSKAIAVDFGAKYRWFNNRLVVGAALRNWGGDIQPFSESDTFPIPLLFEAGVSYVPRYLPALRMACDINKIRGEFVNYEPGIELEVYPQTLFVRLGYPFSHRDLQEKAKTLTGSEDKNYQKSNWSSLALGVGLHTKIGKTDLKSDFGLQFRESWLPPSPVLSAQVDF